MMINFGALPIPVSDEIEIMGGIKIKVLGCELIKGNYGITFDVK